MEMTQLGQWVATETLGSANLSALGRPELFCPFADGNRNEDDLSRDLFPSAMFHSRIGRYVTNYAGYVREGEFRSRGSSGGIASWILCRLLEEGHVDAVVHVGACDSVNSSTSLFGFTISKTADEIRARSKSRYYPVEMSGVVRQVLEKPGRYAVVGLPCFIKALRLACQQSAVLQSRVAHTVGIVCGHLKSTAFAEMMAWQCGIEPHNLRAFDFRTKCADAPASHYAITATGVSRGREIVVTRPVASLFGTNWSHGLFKYKACDYCDDVLAETADIAIGDAWLDDYVKDSGGTNIVTVRTPFFRNLIEEGRASGVLRLDELSADRVAQSQDGGLRHRRDGLSFRLEQARLAGRWTPTKRVEPGSVVLSARQKKRFLVRQKLAEMSHQAFLGAKSEGRLEVFINAMMPLMHRCDQLSKPNVFVRICRGVRRLPRKLWGKLLNSARSMRAAIGAL